MGAQGTGSSVSRCLVLDAGALIALERGSKAVVVIVEQTAAVAAEIVVPASALAQVWRGGPRAALIARAIDGAEIDPLDADRAQEVGLRLGARGADDIADAHVVCCALERGGVVVTSDPNDIEALTTPGESLTLIAA
jgi:predicted nucleic acid-binding protein